MKKVAVIAGKLLPISQTFIREQVRFLKDWEATLVGYDRVPDGLPLEDVPHQFIFGETASSPLKVLRTVCRMFNLANPLVVRALKKVDPNLVHIHFGTVAVGFWPSVRKLDVPVVVTLHGADINLYKEHWQTGKGGRTAKNYPDELLRMAADSRVSFVAVSDAIRERAIEYGIPPDKVTTQYIGIDTEKFSVPATPIEQREKRVLFVGRLVEKKGAEYLIRAFANLAEDIADAELVIAGDGPLREQLERQAAASRLPVSFLGAIPSDQVKEEMHKARVLCLPSVRACNGDDEGFGMVLLEAQACGLPVVTSATGGAKEGVIDGETGFRFEEKDINKLANLLLTVLTNDQLIKQLSGNAPEFVCVNLDIKHCTEGLERLYSRVTQALDFS